LIPDAATGETMAGEGFEWKMKTDRLAETLRGAGHDDVAGALMKDTSINMRVSSQDRREMKAAATYYALSMTEYLLRLHRFADERRKRGKA
jgi:predicted DNA binding CopG/RHH family protein